MRVLLKMIIIIYAVGIILSRMMNHKCQGFTYASNKRMIKNSPNYIIMNLSNRIRTAVLRQLPEGKIDRVIKCWDQFSTGVGLERHLDPPINLVLQTADCFVEGLSAMPFHEIENYKWALNLQTNYEKILQELRDYNRKEKAIQRQLFTTDTEWLPPRDTVGAGSVYYCYCYYY